VSEEQMVRSNIGVLTNVREDHQDVMGFTRAEIARTMLATCPRNGVLVTAEQDPAIQEIMRNEALRRGSRFVVVDPDRVSDEDLKQFDYYSFKENVAIGLAVASLAGIDHATAMRGMIGAACDPGVLRLRYFRVGSKHVTWANLFAINDAESVIAVVGELLGQFGGADTTTVGLLNNRADREDRALQFADVAAHHLHLDWLATLGAYERTVRGRLIANGFPAHRILTLGDSRRPTCEEMAQRLALDMPTARVLVIGMVNIHTAQADELLQFFESAV
jgi:poly-gamma-glutamate synthase PgsB/CapB